MEEVWKHGGKESKISEIDNKQLQEIFNVTQKRQLKALLNLRLTNKLQKAIEREAKKRNLELEPFEQIVTGKARYDYKKKKPLIEAIVKYIIRKEKQLKKCTMKAI